MNLTELRVGNFVSEGGKGAYRVLSVSSESVIIELPESDELPFGAKWKNDARNIEPVPITVEWLIKIGFAFSMIEYEGFRLYFAFDEKIVSIFDLRSLAFFPFPHKVEYVHQLQNLVFALTGEELEVKGGLE